ncbi:copper transporter [Moniliophthora roreri MCA 2997]|uniref:Copper transport protein n=2 Tax=Moniliophthora roreri TaxID=221103 RepID=V2XI45_MONRO|nr:copper transporter [Moniliophthora roreri MCA 2997]KAI3621974.1 copper transporter [Moniliophthora roreri]
MSHAGHDMGSMPVDSGNSTASSAMHMMVPYLHFTRGADVLLFKSIIPSSPGAIFGACLIFFLVAIFDRWLHAYRRGVEHHFKQRASQLQVDFSSTENLRDAAKNGLESEACCAPPKSRFILSHELSRAFLQGAATTLHYLLMLVVMTFNASYIISIILGHVVGEFSFGRLHR